MVLYKVTCNDCDVVYYTEVDETNCELCDSTNITKEQQ
jgi:Zn finger protein HypA/HybF involved in hydrogenase expression